MAFGTVISSTLAGAITGAVLAGGSLALGAISKALAPKLDDQARGRKEEVRSAVAPRTIVYGRARIAGTMVYAGAHGTDNKYLTMVFVVAGHEIDGFEKWFLNDDEVTLDADGFVTAGRFSGKVRILTRLGAANQTALGLGVAEWTVNHKLLGLAHYAVRFEFDPEVFTNGRPRVDAVIRGAKLYDPREDASVPGGNPVGTHVAGDPSTWQWSNNWGLVMLDYLKRDPLGARLPLADIDIGAVVAAANISDEDVQLKGGGTHKRYTADGTVDTRAKRNGVLTNVLSAGAGQLIYQGGKFTLYAGADSPAAITLD
ncbi:MAG: hypothetical protein ACE5EM_12665, partial [Sphingomonadales bacterium]